MMSAILALVILALAVASMYAYYQGNKKPDNCPRRERTAILARVFARS